MLGSRLAVRERLAFAALAAVLASVFASPAAADAPWRSFKALKFYVHDDVDTDARVLSQKGRFLVAPGGPSSCTSSPPRTTPSTAPPGPSTARCRA